MEGPGGVLYALHYVGQGSVETFFLSPFKHGCGFEGKNLRFRWSISEIELNRRLSTIYLEVGEKKSEKITEGTRSELMFC